MSEKDIHVSAKCKAGDIAGSIAKPHGHIRIGLNGKSYLAHRIAWKMFYGKEPPLIDHVDGDPANNAIKNLRSVNMSMNNKNKSLDKRSKTGVSGIYYNESMKQYHARFTVEGNRIHVGYFNCLNKAKSELFKRRKQYGYTERHGQK